MNNSNIHLLLKAKKLHVKIAKQGFAHAQNEFTQAQEKVELMQEELSLIQLQSSQKQKEALSIALAGRITNATFAIVRNIYEITKMEILQQQRTIWQGKQIEKKAKLQLEKAKGKLAKSMQKEEKISYIANKITKEIQIKEELISEGK